VKFRGQKALRSGEWKYLVLDGDEFLFDLSRDQRERANLARRHPDRLADLRARYAAWEAALPPIPRRLGQHSLHQGRPRPAGVPVTHQINGPCSSSTELVYDG
jgi:arylsulfatase A-like enzyme